MELIRPSKQKVWGWPGVVNFALGGAGAGFYLLGELAGLLWQGGNDLAVKTASRLAGPALVGLGLLALTVETGHPLRGRYLLRHLRRSWMSRESLSGFIFILAALLSGLLPSPALEGVAAAAALGLLVSHGFILYRAVAVVAWNVPLMVALFVTSGLAMGGGLLLLVPPDEMGLEDGLVAMALFWITLDLTAWLLYLFGLRGPAFREATAELRHPSSLVLTVGVGRLLPAALLALSLVGLWGGDGRPWAGVVGLSVFAGGVGQKAGTVLKAGYLRGIRLEGVKGDAEGKRPVFSLWLPPVGDGGRSDGQ